MFDLLKMITENVENIDVATSNIGYYTNKNL